jgi:hypothetical protein
MPFAVYTPAPHVYWLHISGTAATLTEARAMSEILWGEACRQPAAFDVVVDLLDVSQFVARITEMRSVVSRPSHGKMRSLVVITRNPMIYYAVGSVIHLSIPHLRMKRAESRTIAAALVGISEGECMARPLMPLQAETTTR